MLLCLTILLPKTVYIRTFINTFSSDRSVVGIVGTLTCETFKSMGNQSRVSADGARRVTTGRAYQ